MVGGVSQSFIRSRPRPTTSARTSGVGPRSVTEVSTPISTRTGTTISVGRSPLTTSQMTNAKNVATSFNGRCSVNAAVTRFCHGVVRRHLPCALGEELPHESAVPIGVPVDGADHLLADHAVAPDDERLGIARRLVVARDVALAIVQHLEREAELLDELTDGAVHAGLIDADGHDAEVGVLELAVERLELGISTMHGRTTSPRC